MLLNFYAIARMTLRNASTIAILPLLIVDTNLIIDQIITIIVIVPDCTTLNYLFI